MVASKTFVYNFSATWALFTKSQHPIVASGFIDFFFEPSFYDSASCWVMLLVVIAFETEIFSANAFDVLLRNKICFSAQVFASGLRTPSGVLVVVSVISVVPKHIFSVIIKFSRLKYLARRKELKEQRIRNDNITVLLLTCCIYTLATSFNFLLQMSLPRISTKLMAHIRETGFISSSSSSKQSPQT